MKRVAINGFGRIGRLCLRVLLKNSDIQVVAINDLADEHTLAHLFKYDSVQGKFPGEVKAAKGSIEIDGQVVYVYSSADPSQLPWGDLNIDVVVECTGFFRKYQDAAKHIKAGAKKVVLSAPPKTDDIKGYVIGINDHTMGAEEVIVSNASCTTNCAAPMMQTVLDNWGVQQGILSTVHAYTSDQKLHDAPHKDLRRARAAGENIIPTSTGAANALIKLFPALSGKMHGTALRVPVASGSLTELTLLTEKLCSENQVNAIFEKVCREKYAGIMEYSSDPLVSSDIIGNPVSCVFDSELTKVQGHLLKISGWYDNEFGYSNRLAELVIKV